MINFQEITAEEKYASIAIKDGLVSIVDTLLNNETITNEERSALAAIRSKIAVTL